jgi:hypothetical protein
MGVKVMAFWDLRACKLMDVSEEHAAFVFTLAGFSGMLLNSFKTVLQL